MLLPGAKPGLGKALRPAMAALVLCALAAARGAEKEHDRQRQYPERSHPDKLPPRPTLPPSFSIPVEPLGFAAPGNIYLGLRFSLASLDFLDEDRLLFTFRVPGLIHRQHTSGEEGSSDEHHIRAVVLALPSGTVQAENVWALHDRARYLWMLKGGHFLVRDRDELEMGDASLALKPYLRFPGPVLDLAMDPSQEFLVTNSREPVADKPKPGEVTSPATAASKIVADDDAKGGSFEPDLVLRILKRESGRVMMVSRVRSPVDLSLNSDGYLELLPARGDEWLINLNKFGGAPASLGKVDSTCSPTYDFISQREFLVTTCTRSDLRMTAAITTGGRRLWEDLPTSSPVWPLIVASADGSRMARESLAVNHPVTAYSPLSFDDVRGQVVEVFDAATGKIELAAPANPVLDGGGNVAISPSGRRVAILDAGSIQVFDLPAAPALPEDPARIEVTKNGH
jgi:hypothetical protein